MYTLVGLPISKFTVTGLQLHIHYQYLNGTMMYALLSYDKHSLLVECLALARRLRLNGVSLIVVMVKDMMYSFFDST